MSLVRIQTSESTPVPSGVSSGTDLLLAPERVADRLRHFAEEVYDLSAESHLVRFLKVLLGDAGAGQLRKRLVIARLQSTMHGSHFYDLDRFYGALFDARRQVHEVLTLNPYVDTAVADVWDDQHARDASYRSRMAQFARAISFGPTPLGMELAAEAILSTDVEVYESYVDADRDDTVLNRREFVVRPKRTITMEEAYDLRRALYKIKPADARLVIDADGVAVHDPIALQGVWADSTYWEIAVEVAARTLASSPYAAPSPFPTEQPRPPFSGYQGEAWSYNGDLVAVAPYTGTGATPTFLPTQRVTLPDGTFIDYPASSAVLPQRYLLAGRAVSDAILISHPYSGTRTAPADAIESLSGQVFQPINVDDTTDLAPLYVDRIPLDALNKTIQRTNDLTAFEQNPSQRFWITPERFQEDGTEEVLEVRLREDRKINYLSFDVSHFPHSVEVEVFDEQTSRWNQVFGQTIIESVPSQITAAIRDEHPYHSRPDHWVRCTARIEPVDSSRLRLVLRRGEGLAPTAPPRALYGSDRRVPQPVAYSLGVRNLDFGYRVTSRDDVPDSDVIATSVDTLGSVVQYRLKEKTPESILTGGTWKCEPQPVSYAVVNFFADTRTVEGDPQVIDRFYLDPTVAGPHLTIYYSNDTTDPIDQVVDGGTPQHVLSGGIVAIDGGAPWDIASVDNDGGDPDDLGSVSIDGGGAADPGLPGGAPIFDAQVDGGGPTSSMTASMDGGSIDSVQGGEMTWTPIPADYTLQKGFVRIPPTSARYWKFEFTNLVAEPYESFLPLLRRVKLFPAGQVARSAITGTGTALEHFPPGSNAAIALGAIQHYADAVRALRQVAYEQRYTPTEALFSTDPASAERLREQSWAFGFNPWHLSDYAPRFTTTEPHRYEEVELRHTTKVAFFVGLKDLRAYRLDPDADDDAEVYVERFWNADHIEDGFTWQFDPGAMSTGVDAEAVATSKVMRSQHDVVALQFATQQSPAAQLIPDDDLRDPHNIVSDWSDPYSFHKVGDAQVQYLADSHSVRLTRYVNLPPRPVTVEPGLVQPFVHPIFTFRDFTVEDTEAQAATYGGFESGLISPSNNGRVYAAARVFLETDLTSPLKLQITSASNGEVLVEREAIGRKGEMLEWVVPYDLNTFFIPAPPTKEFEYRSGFVNRFVAPIFAGNDTAPVEDVPPAPPPPTDDEIIRVRVIQQGKSDDQFRLDTLSLFDEGIVWEFSVDGGATFVSAKGIRNHVYGVLTFPEPGNELVWRAKGSRPGVNVSSLKIRPWYRGLRGNQVESTQRGPNVSSFDLSPPIQDDPEFNTWQKPIPRSWYFESRRSPGLSIAGAPNETPFQRFYGRPATEDLPTPVDVGTRSMVFYRSGAETLTTTDEGTRQGDFARMGTDDLNDATDYVNSNILRAIPAGFVTPFVQPI